jgi:hypothetical protein
MTQSPIAKASKAPKIDRNRYRIHITCQRGHILASVYRDEDWAGSRAEMLAGLKEVECDRCGGAS